MKRLVFAKMLWKLLATPSPPNKVVYKQGCSNEEEVRGEKKDCKVRLDNGQRGGKTSSERPPGPFGEFSRWRAQALIILTISEPPPPPPLASASVRGVEPQTQWLPAFGSTVMMRC